MKLETFFEKFELLAEMPGAVGKLRELVLDLAMRGRLVPQDPSDEPAATMLERNTTSAKSRQRESNGAEQFNSPFEIPEGWVWVRLPRVLTKLTDGTHHSPPNGPVGDFMYVTAKNIKDGGILLDGITYVARQTHEEIYSRCNPSQGDVLYIKDGATTGIATINQIDQPFSMLSSVALLKPSGCVLNTYLLWALRSPFFYAETRGAMKGAAITRVTLSVMASSLLPLPPLAEQKRIVAKVDELMALCDRLEAQQQERETRRTALARASLAQFADAPTPANLSVLFHPSYAIPPADLRHSILTLAVQGKLVPQDPSDEPAEKLLAVIAKQRVELFGSTSLRKTKPCRQFTSDEAPYEIPITWVWTMLGEVTDIGTGGTPPRTETSFWMDGTIPWITSGSTSHSIITEGTELVTPAAVKACRLRVYQPGTLLVALYGQGKTRGQVAALEIPATVNQACAAICPLEGLPTMQSYLKLLLEKKYDEMRSLSAGGAQPNLNVQKVKEVFVPLPPLAEQSRIVAKVEQLMASVDEMEKQLIISLAGATRLLAAISISRGAS